MTQRAGISSSQISGAESFEFLMLFKKCICNFEVASAISSAALAIYQYAPFDKAVIFDFLQGVVNKEWSITCPQVILEELLGSMIDVSPDPLITVDTFVNEACVALAERDEEILVRFPQLTHETFLIYYKSSLHGLCKLVQNSLLSDDQVEENLDWLSGVCALFTSTVQLISKFQHDIVIVQLLKYSRTFVELLMKHVIPFITAQFKPNRDVILSLLRTVQKATRTVQTVCNEYKVTRDNGISASIPLVRKTLETFLYQVKAMLANNDYLAAFSFGNLKHRDVSGKEVGSQRPVQIESSDDEQEPDNNLQLPAIDEDFEELEYTKLDLPPTPRIGNKVLVMPNVTALESNLSNDLVGASSDDDGEPQTPALSSRTEQHASRKRDQKEESEDVSASDASRDSLAKEMQRVKRAKRKPSQPINQPTKPATNKTKRGNTRATAVPSQSIATRKEDDSDQENEATQMQNGRPIFGKAVGMRRRTEPKPSCTQARRIGLSKVKKRLRDEEMDLGLVDQDSRPESDLDQLDESDVLYGWIA